jgi:CDP-4-dehydro-6-deoxyglucose reductase, E3
MPLVTLYPTGRSFLADPGEPVLSAALRAGLNLPHSCKGGHCASCKATLLQGKIAYPGERPLGLSADEAAAGQVLLCQARALDDLLVQTREVRAAVEAEIKSLPCRIDALDLLAPDVLAVTLRLPAVESLPFRAGQYVDVMLAGERRRSFSIASAPADGPRLVLHVRRAASGEFTTHLFERRPIGELLRIEGPLGQLTFRPESPRHALFVAGGTGYAPLRSMLRQLIADRDPRPVTLYWGMGARAELYEHDWLESLQRERPGFEYRPVLSADDAEPAWRGRRGFVHEAVLAEHPDLAPFDVYAAGPPAMIEAIRSGFAVRGLPAAQLYFDSFDYAPDAQRRLAQGAPARGSPAAGGSEPAPA